MLFIFVYPVHICYLQMDSSDKGHGVLAPFTAGRQITDNEPLVIERSEVFNLH